MTDQSFLDLLIRWVVLTAMFLSLVYLFRDRVMPEGAGGFALALFLLLPINVFAGSYFGSADLALEASLVPFAFLGAIAAINFVLLEAFVHLLPGLSVSSQWALLLFVILLSLVSGLVRLMPNLTSLVPPGVLD